MCVFSTFMAFLSVWTASCVMLSRPRRFFLSAQSSASMHFSWVALAPYCSDRVAQPTLEVHTHTSHCVSLHTSMTPYRECVCVSSRQLTWEPPAPLSLSCVRSDAPPVPADSRPDPPAASGSSWWAALFPGGEDREVKKPPRQMWWIHLASFP